MKKSELRQLIREEIKNNDYIELKTYIEKLTSKPILQAWINWYNGIIQKSTLKNILQNALPDVEMEEIFNDSDEYMDPRSGGSLFAYFYDADQFESWDITEEQFDKITHILNKAMTFIFSKINFKNT